MPEADPERALPAAFYSRSAEAVARDLLGAFLISRVAGRLRAAEIVETEAYTGPDDEASHGFRRIGRTARNASMFGPPGTAYIYRSYGIHWCLNPVVAEEGFPAAVLIRAARPVLGLDAIRELRPGRADHELLRGPGNVCRGLAIGGALDAHPLDRPPLWIEAGANYPEEAVFRGPRIGISRARDLPLRFWVRGDLHVSARRSPPSL